ncbi:MAG TPA: LysM peptidoglycan-binding domain-containing protein [Thermoanaerobaculia bacterium]|jgi:LysM repeat protein|nr:LysM peptidoglycan-binding domain-containing protein [Thermoanaerobaculia bacterium]
MKMPDDKKDGIVSGGGTSVGSDNRASGIVSGGGSQLSSREENTLQTYTVVQGDSLSKIAKRVYGKASLWRKIYEINQDQIKDPDLIFPGQLLRLPEV